MNCSTRIAESCRQKAPVSLDQARLKKTAEGLIALVEMSLPAGCSDWAARCRPDVAKYLTEAVDGIRAAVAVGDADGAITAFNYCTSLYPKVVRIYRRETVSGVSEKYAAWFSGGETWAG